MGIVCWQNNLPLEHLGFSIAETPTTKYVGPNFIKRRHIKSQTLEHDFTNTKSDPLSAYCINSCFSCMCVCDVPRRDRFVTTMGDNRGMKGHESMDWMFVDLRWSNHLVFHCRSSLLGAWCLANSIRISHPVVFDSQPVNTQLTSSDRGSLIPTVWRHELEPSCLWMLLQIQPDSTGGSWHWMSVKSPLSVAMDGNGKFPIYGWSSHSNLHLWGIWCCHYILLLPQIQCFMEWCHIYIYIS